MLLTKKVTVSINGQTAKHYESLGYHIPRRKSKWGDYSCEAGTMIEVDVHHLKDGSHVQVEVLCDYCLEKNIKTIVKKEWKRYLRDTVNSTVQKDCCAKCQQIKTKECNLINFGVENKCQLDEYKQKVRQSILNRYGVEHALQSQSIKDKMKATNLEKYGVDNPMKVKEISQKAANNAQNTNMKRYGVKSVLSLETTIAKQRETYYKNGTTPTSKQQRYLHKILGGELNYPVGNCSLDIAFTKEKIYIEYSGGGHDLIVKLGGMSQEEFKTKEIKRYQYLKSKGWKGIFIDSHNDYLPKDDVIFDEINKAKEIFKSKKASHYNIDVNNLSCELRKII